MTPGNADGAPAGLERDAWGSRWGYVLAMVGSAVGLGNIVRFPFVTSEQGGAVFVLLYVVAVVLFGIPMLLTELTLGRRSQRSVVGTFEELGGGHWGKFGVALVFFNVFVMSWFSVIGAWSLIYVWEGLNPAYWDDPTGFFFSINEGPVTLGFHAVFITVTVGIVAFGVSKGIEPAVKVLLPLLGVLLVGLAVYALTLEGAMEGVRYYLEPDFGVLSAGTFVAAAGQAFFSLSVGFGALITYASYIDRESNLSTDSVTVGFTDVGVALVAGFLVFPLLAAFALLGTPEAAQGGIGVAFLALPNAFATIGGGLGVFLVLVFFGLLFVAALSSSISLMEVGVSWVTDRGVPRWKGVVLLGLVMYGLGIPMAFSSGLLDFAAGAFTDTLLLGSAFVIAVFLGWLYRGKLGEDPVVEMDRGASGFRLGLAAFWLIRFVIPVVLLGLFVVAVWTLVGDVGALL